MSTALRIVLIAGAMGTMVYFLWQIRKNRLQIVYAISWSLFSIVLVALSLFPQILSFFANLLGVVSPTNLLYLVIIFVLILKQFGATIKLSRMDRQITELTQTLALKEARRQTDDPQNG